MTAPLLPGVVLPMRVRYELDGLPFNDRDRFGCEWVVNEEEGWTGSTAPRTSRTERVNAHGSYRGPSYRDARTISLSGICAAPSEAARRTAEQRIAAVCAEPDTLYTFTATEEVGVFTSQVELDDKVAVTTRGPRWFEWSIQLAAVDPRKYAAEVGVAETGLAPIGIDGLDFGVMDTVSGQSGLDFGTGLPEDGLVFGESNSLGFMTLVNRGTAPTYPVMTLRGPLSNPRLTVEGGSIRYNGDLEAGDELVIDPSVPAVLLGGTASRRHLVSPADFRAFAVPPRSQAGRSGRLDVGLTHMGVFNATGKVNARYRAAYF